MPSKKIAWKERERENYVFLVQGFCLNFWLCLFWSLYAILQLEPSILHAICIRLFGVGTSPFACCLLHFRAGIFLFTCYLQQFWSWNLAYRTPVATFVSWNLRFCMILRMEEILHQLEAISNYETL